MYLNLVYLLSFNCLIKIMKNISTDNHNMTPWWFFFIFQTKITIGFEVTKVCIRLITII